MISMTNQQLLIDNKPVLIFSGEVHYFRLPKAQWRKTLLALKATGMNTVSTYIPWLVHEEVEGEFDFTGVKDERHDLVSFIQLVQELGLYLIARPGPFVMAELKNEGIPYWVAQKHPDAVPTTWDSKKVPTHTLDYSNKGFQKDAQKWYAEAAHVLKPFLQPNGGPVIGIQTDNEIGMLSWVANAPDLTDQSLKDFSSWLKQRYGASLPAEYPSDFLSSSQFNSYVRSPEDQFVLRLENDLGQFNRQRFANYAVGLIDAAKRAGVVQVPFFINVHGTDQGRGETFPIAISQLYELFKLQGVLIGTDVYFGDFTFETATHLYTINRFMQAVDGKWPLSTLEFNSSSGNHDDHEPTQTDASALPLKTRLQIAQGTKVINNYLFSGGYNRKLEIPVADGNSRIGIHGWRHGFGSLLNPEGKPAFIFSAIKQLGQTIAHTDIALAKTTSSKSAVMVGFLPDTYMTESCYPGSEKAKQFAAELVHSRATMPWNNLFKNLLSAKLNFDALDLQQNSLNPEKTPILVVPSGKAMASEIQHKLLDYVEAGGDLVLSGQLPEVDLVGNPATDLIDALQIVPDAAETENAWYFPTILGAGWAEKYPEVRVSNFQTFTSNGETFLYEEESKKTVGATIDYHKGRVTVLTTEWRFDPEFYLNLFSRIGVQPAMKLFPAQVHVIALQTKTAQGEFIHLMNTEDTAADFRLTDTQTTFNGQVIHLKAKEGLILPVNQVFDDWHVVYATGEVAAVSPQQISFDLPSADSVIALDEVNAFLPSENAWSEQKGAHLLIHPRHAGRLILCREEGLIFAE